MEKIAGVVVWYNPSPNDVQKTYINAQQLEKIYIIDNSSSDNVSKTKELLNAEYIWCLKNVGLGAALNLGVCRAMEEGYKWLITLDQDSQFTSGFVKTYQEYIYKNRSSRLFALAPVYDIKRKQQKIAKSQYTPISVTMQSGCAFNLELLKKIHGFYEPYFIECIDYEIFFKALKENFQVIRCNHAILYHEPALNYEIRIVNRTLQIGIASPERYYYQFRNLIHLSRKYPKFILYKHLFQKLIKVIFFFPNKQEYFRYIFKGVKDAYNDKLGVISNGV